jgi:pyruvate ferredoxin oxidoreductase gamma subunit
VYRIRFHGRGGQGIKTASRLLGTALFRSRFEVQDAPRYGAERRGAPIFAYVRADRHPILERGIIRQPDLVIVADDSLVPVPAAGVLAGIRQNTVVLIRSREDAGTWRHRLNLGCSLIQLLPQGEDDRSGLPFVGAVCAGAAARLLGTVDRDTLGDTIREEQAPLGPAIVARNLTLALDAFDAMAAHAGSVTEGRAASAGHYRPPAWIDPPLDLAAMSAPVIHGALTSLDLPTGSWRTLRPVIDLDRCKRCWWVCSSFCPDGAIRVESGTPAIDYDHCKGCLICVAQCPPHAIEASPEARARETP